MKRLFMLTIIFFSGRAFCQITYTYVDSDPAIEKEKKDKEAYFENLTSNITNKLRDCERQCGSYAADANNPKDPCIVPGITPKCICDCRAFYNPSLARIIQQEKAWRADIFAREENYRRKKLKEQQSETNKVINEPIDATNQQTDDENLDPVKEMQLKQQQLQHEFNSAQDASTTAFENALNSGKKTSGAMVDATLAGSQYISDPKASLAYTGVGLSVALISWISEKKEAQRAAMLEREQAERLSRQSELQRMKESLHTSTAVFNFITATTKYHVTNLKINLKHGMVKSIVRKDLYDVSVTVHKVLNDEKNIFIYESVMFKNLSSSKDSCVVSKISLPINSIREAQLYDGNYSNSYDPKSNIDQLFRHKSLTNAGLKEAFKIDPMYNEGSDIGAIKSHLTDVNITTLGNSIKIQKKYTLSMPIDLTDKDFDGINSYSTNNYLLVFDADDWSNKPGNFVDYLNYIKN